MKNIKWMWFILFGLIMALAWSVSAQKNGADDPIDNNPVLGRWDFTVYDIDGVFPSWLELTEAEGGLQGRFQGRHSSWRPVRDIRYDARTLRIALPAYDYEREGGGDLVYTAEIVNEALEGVDDREVRFRGLPAPELKASADLSWGDPVELLRDDDLSAWMPRSLGSPNGWSLSNGVLSATPPSTDLVTRRRFTDFKLHLEFNVPEKSNSGVYLRGRYELQITDDFGKEAESHGCGGLYGFIAPAKMMVNPAGQWNSWDITLIGRNLTLVFNGETVIAEEEIPGITGSAINSREAEPGPIMLQCHGAPIYYRNIVIRPAELE